MFQIDYFFCEFISLMESCFKLTISGINVGTVLSMAFSGLLCDSALGWPSVFYLSGKIHKIMNLSLFILA